MLTGPFSKPSGRGWKLLTATNTLAYYSTNLITDTKSFTKEAARNETGVGWTAYYKSEMFYC